MVFLRKDSSNVLALKANEEPEHIGLFGKLS
jgi:hypothetical protein